MTEVHKSRAASIDLDNVWSFLAADNPEPCSSCGHQQSLAINITHLR